MATTSNTAVASLVLGAAILVVSSIGGCMAGFPKYKVYQQRMEGEAERAKAEYSKQVQVLDAEAKKQSAQAFADAEVIRAQGVAKANAIIGESLRNNEAYLRYLWITKLSDAEGKGQVIYFPPRPGCRFSKPGALLIN